MKNEDCTKILKLLLKPEYTAVSYAIRVHDEIVASDALGVIDKRDNQPISEDCTFNVCSISKIYCTVAVMQLVEKGLIKLEQPVTTILPEFWMPDERYKKITVRMCLDHSSGLPGTQWKHFNLTEVGSIDYYKEVLHYFSKSHLKAEPGEYSVYCNDGFTLAEMVVAKVSGMRYEDYVKQYITDPIGADSTRLSSTLNPDYPLVSEGKKPKELLLVQGAGGITTNMIDLTKFGQLFLKPNEIISEESKALMAKKWGATFLSQDEGTSEYGLGWDTVCLHEPVYHFNCPVLVKGGNSMIFSSRLIIIPEYDAVLAIAETHDCGLDIQNTILRMFAEWLRQNGKVITDYDAVEKETAQELQGLYLQPSSGIMVDLIGETMILRRKNAKGQWELNQLLDYQNGKWWNNSKEAWFFDRDQEDIYLMNQNRNKTVPVAMKARNYPQLSDAWRARLNHSYIVCNASIYDLAVGQLLAAFTLKEEEAVSGIIKMVVHSRKTDGFISGVMEMPFIPESDDVGRGFLRTPANGSRDLVDPFFERFEGREYVEAASYRYICADDVKSYEQEGFLDQEENQVYKLENGLKEMISIPSGHRVIVLDKDFCLVYDSLDQADFTPVEQGWIILV